MLQLIYFTVHTIQYNNQLPFSCILLSYFNVQYKIMLSYTLWWYTSQIKYRVGSVLVVVLSVKPPKYSWSFTSERFLSSSCCSCYLNWYSLSSTQDTPFPSATVPPPYSSTQSDGMQRQAGRVLCSCTF